ncbi:hypothetical protein SAMN02983003_0593 [Devosia enhydra]|uniref:Uncharacterized protein n=1 Tax=Devosia enhydra TaxID=665118 RepID=A0A1K2HTM2_9HYPH|nr:hypothetical protein [Devosia enhydra]SFZ81612.1 hypothetical protein SAMN02983003_0593 [Devosia enhydra]
MRTPALDQIGQPIEVGDRVCWGVVNAVRVGTITEIVPIKDQSSRWYGASRTHTIRTTTTTEAKPTGRGGSYWNGSVIRIPHPTETPNV